MSRRVARPARDGRREPSVRIVHEPAFERVVLPSEPAEETEGRISAEHAIGASALVAPAVASEAPVVDRLEQAIASAEQSAADRLLIVPPHEPARAPGIGAHLRRERELRAVSLEEIARTTRIPLNVLRSLEADDAKSLPGDVFVRGFLRSYARALGLDAEPLVARYDAGRGPTVVASTLATSTPERGRRFGLAIAVVVLLILFTLALSIVLRPRHRNVPVELSSAPTSSLDLA
ncbi:MAG: helix-turn-helix domain-containing protein [Myxococcales bacterium]|nr:helix-turn-helix domain-containing protein [Myxococcales bacterium]